MKTRERRPRYTRKWTWPLLALALLVLAGGIAAALIIRYSRSTSELETLDIPAAAEMIEAMIDNTNGLAEEWQDGELPEHTDYLQLVQQESLARLDVENERADSLEGQLQAIEEGDIAARREMGEALGSLIAAHIVLEEALDEAGTLISSLGTVRTADAAYASGTQKMLAAVESHNQVASSESPDFSGARREAESSLASLAEAETLLQSASVEGLDLDPALSAVASIKTAAERFMEACDKTESGDAAGHNVIMGEVHASLSEAPASLFDTLGVPAWIRSYIDEYLERVFDLLDQSREALRSI
ncbi:MAG: hypothetical protein SWK76_01965 [Actinomycetota bacterium]|nr:hypothetical protein [Actinomycetota bacterium]